MKKIILLLLLMVSSPAFSTIYVYKGNIADKQMTLYLKPISQAFWVYDDDPKQIQHKLNYGCELNNSCSQLTHQTNLELYDAHDLYIDPDNQQIKAKKQSHYFIFNDIHLTQNQETTLLDQTLEGYWFNGSNNQHYPVKLSQQLVIDKDSNTQFTNVELLQLASTDHHYFTAVFSKQKMDKIKLVGINVYAKNNHQLLQKIKNLNYSDNGFMSIDLQDINFDGILDLAIKKYRSRQGDNLDYYINDKGAFTPTHLWGSNIEFNPKDKSAIGSKDCYDLDDKQQRVQTKIESVYQYKNYQYIFVKNRCQIINIDNKTQRNCLDAEYNACLLNRNNINRENPNVIGEDNILYKNMAWDKGKLIDGVIDD
ncbi:hypothetical protein J3U57_02845 [Gilliamella sp. B3464]|uniref:hypothetical protein n=1 Tax=unclassified Gilliamella TaxID=2685620 RepID=UPI002269DAE1|nr:MULTISPECIES: hypothetical protein [unclassified Gilliamella]MCX8711589.1 hypothetical protein [Gilliamella sp. B3468]MCX8750510.1 hypothetical protein [Gilliamella sp. B3464]